MRLLCAPLLLRRLDCSRPDAHRNAPPMYTVNGFGLPICLQQLYDQSEEASFIAREIARCAPA